MNHHRYGFIAACIFFSMTLTAQASQSGPHWGYEGAAGPAAWGAMGFPVCSQGKTQSPVNISQETPTNQKPISFDYVPSPINAVNNGHTVQFNFQPGSFIMIDGKRFDLKQFHFHSPSEDTVDGKAFAVQMHLVHKSADDQLAVVGVFMEEDGTGTSHSSGNSSLDKVFGALPGNSGLTLTGTELIDIRELLPKDQQAWHFMGSLTTPPCSEGVAWYVMKKPITIAPKQLARFRSIYHGNARPVQPWNSRQ